MPRGTGLLPQLGRTISQTVAKYTVCNNVQTLRAVGTYKILISELLTITYFWYRLADDFFKDIQNTNQ
jgi:hypothetical protein